MKKSRTLNLNLSEIDIILNGYYRDKISSTQLSKTLKISPSKIKNVIKNYTTAFLNKFPEYKPIDNVSVDMYEQHILSSGYIPSKLEQFNKNIKPSEKVSSIMD